MPGKKDLRKGIINKQTKKCLRSEEEGKKEVKRVALVTEKKV